jgi:Lon protease-like protein
MHSPFAPAFDQLPASLPIFPLENAIALPGAQVPLNIFEPRYLNMVFDALGADRLIGMIQPAPPGAGGELYPTGTAGLITSFSESADGRLLVVLTGLCRFDIGEELQTTRGYRRVVPDWTPYRADYEGDDAGSGPRLRLMGPLRAFLDARGIQTDWESLQNLPTTRLVNILSGQLPLDVAERQTLIEAPTAELRADRLAGMLEQSIAASPEQRPH